MVKLPFTIFFYTIETCEWNSSSAISSSTRQHSKARKSNHPLLRYEGFGSKITSWNLSVRLTFQEHVRAAQVSHDAKYKPIYKRQPLYCVAVEWVQRIRESIWLELNQKQTIQMIRQNPTLLCFVPLPKNTVYAKPWLVLTQVSSLTTYNIG